MSSKSSSRSDVSTFYQYCTQMNTSHIHINTNKNYYKIVRVPFGNIVNFKPACDIISPVSNNMEWWCTHLIPASRKQRHTFVNLRLAWSTWQVQEQSGLHRETVSKTKQNLCSTKFNTLFYVGKRKSEIPPRLFFSILSSFCVLKSKCYDLQLLKCSFQFLRLGPYETEKALLIFIVAQESLPQIMHQYIY